MHINLPLTCKPNAALAALGRPMGVAPCFMSAETLVAIPEPLRSQFAAQAKESRLKMQDAERRASQNSCAASSAREAYRRRLELLKLSK